jgi:hypothetical protein
MASSLAVALEGVEGGFDRRFVEWDHSDLSTLDQLMQDRDRSGARARKQHDLRLQQGDGGYEP